ncbi:hypothetical protein [Microbispora rosea]
MPERVGEGLLHDAVDRDGRGGGDRGQVPVFVEGDVEPGGAGVGDERAER